jgi:hypothetical protein
MKKLTILIVALTILIPSLGYCDMLTIRLGYYMPDAFSNSYLSSHPESLFATEFNQMSFLPSDFRGSILGLGYEFFLTKKLSFAISVDTFSHENGGYYRDYVGITMNTTGLQGEYAFPAASYQGDAVQHSMDVSMTPIQFSLKFLPLGRKVRFIPYLGGGAGLYFVNAAIRGEIVDFSNGQLVSDANQPALGNYYIYPVVLAAASETRAVIGGHAFAGLMFPIGYRLTLEVEARYHYVKANLSHAFPDYGTIDLSGLALSIGLNYWF